MPLGVERRIVKEQAAEGVPLERRRAARPDVVEFGLDPQLWHELKGAPVGVLDERAVRAVAPGAHVVAVHGQKVSVDIRRVIVVVVVLMDWRVADQVAARVGAAEHVVADEERRATLMRDAPLRVHALVVHRHHAGPRVSAPGGERADPLKLPHAVALAHLARLRADGCIVDEAHVVRVGPLREHQQLDPRLRLEVALRHPREVAFTLAGHAGAARAGRAGAMVDLARGLRAGVGQRAGRPAGVGGERREGEEECGHAVRLWTRGGRSDASFAVTIGYHGAVRDSQSAGAAPGGAEDAAATPPADSLRRDRIVAGSAAQRSAAAARAAAGAARNNARTGVFLLA